MHLNSVKKVLGDTRKGGSGYGMQLCFAQVMAQAKWEWAPVIDLAVCLFVFMPEVLPLYLVGFVCLLLFFFGGGGGGGDLDGGYLGAFLPMQAPGWVFAQARLIFLITPDLEIF